MLLKDYFNSTKDKTTERVSQRNDKKYWIHPFLHLHPSNKYSWLYCQNIFQTYLLFMISTISKLLLSLPRLF